MCIASMAAVLVLEERARGGGVEEKTARRWLGGKKG